jgi:hypothetical protein
VRPRQTDANSARRSAATRRRRSTRRERESSDRSSTAWRDAGSRAHRAPCRTADAARAWRRARPRAPPPPAWPALSNSAGRKRLSRLYGAPPNWRSASTPTAFSLMSGATSGRPQTAPCRPPFAGGRRDPAVAPGTRGARKTRAAMRQLEAALREQLARAKARQRVRAKRLDVILQRAHKRRALERLLGGGEVAPSARA